MRAIRVTDSHTLECLLHHGSWGWGEGGTWDPDMVIISLLRIAGLVISPLCWPNIQMIAALISSVMQTVSQHHRVSHQCRALLRKLTFYSQTRHTAATGSELKMMKIKFFELFWWRDDVTLVKHSPVPPETHWDRDSNSTTVSSPSFQSSFFLFVNFQG